ncbi:MAG: exopolysaccharide biosynthesis protein [Alphaproteobacteria bacterium]|nr:exopolysaccharide biosynthesis protein [Alphaproteobacteria bacterium]
MSKSGKLKKIKPEKDSVKEKDVHFIESLKDVLKSHKSDSITFGDIMAHLKEEGLIFLIAIVSFPTAIPVPTPPGFTTLFGIPLCVLTIQMIYKLDAPWLPKWLANKKVKVSTFKGFIDKAEPMFNKMSGFLKPRHKHLTTQSMERLVGVLAFICSVSIALPILFGNAVPSAGILVMSVGLLYKDGLTVLIGMITSVIGIIISSTVVAVMSFFGIEVLHRIIDTQVLDKF